MSQMLARDSVLLFVPHNAIIAFNAAVVEETLVNLVLQVQMVVPVED